MYVDDITRLRHMLDASRQAVAAVRGRARADLDADPLLALALVKLVEIVGEAASRTTRQLHAAHPEIPWADIVGMRHILVHNYFDVELDEVWRVVSRDLTELIAAIEAFLPPWQESS